jgi:integrase/recombinase XerD
VVDDDDAGVSLRTVRRRLSIVSGLYGFLHARGDVAANPVPRGLPTRRERQRPHQGVPLVRRVRTLPPILTLAEVDALTGALRTHRDRAMVAAMVLGVLCRCEVLGLRPEDVRVAERRVFIADGKGGRQRLMAGVPPVLRPCRRLPRMRATGRLINSVFVVLKGPRRGRRCRPTGWTRSSRTHAAGRPCRMRRVTSCGTPARLREAGMALKAVQAQAGHASIGSTRIYLHLADDWLASQYRRAAEVLDAQLFADKPTAGGAR